MRVNSYSLVERSVLFDDVEVGRYCRIRNAIMDKNVKIPPHTEIGYDLEFDRARGFTVTPEGRGGGAQELPLLAMEKHPGKLFYRLSRLCARETSSRSRRKPKAKVYANPLETQALPPVRPGGGPPSFRALAHLAAPSSPRWGSALTLQDLSQVLYPLAERRRAAGLSLGGEAYPLEAYLVALRVEGMFPGVYHYFSKEHQLFQIWPRGRRWPLVRGPRGPRPGKGGGPPRLHPGAGEERGPVRP